MEGVLVLAEYAPPRYCPNCGEPFPWQQSALDAARELADTLDGLTPHQREALKQDLVDVAHDTPRTPAAANRVKRVLSALGHEAAPILRKVLEGIATAAAKQKLGR